MQQPVRSMLAPVYPSGLETLARFLHRVVADVELIQPGGRRKAGGPKSGLVDAARAA